MAQSMDSYWRCCLVKLCSEDTEADKERAGGWTVVSGWLFFQYKVNKSQPVIRSLGLGKATEAFQEKRNDEEGEEFITTAPACRDM